MLATADLRSECLQWPSPGRHPPEHAEEEVDGRLLVVISESVAVVPREGLDHVATPFLKRP